MKIRGLDKDFIVIGENIHTTRVVLRKGKRVGTNANGDESIVFASQGGSLQYLSISEEAKRSQDYEEGRVKHVKIAVKAAMAEGTPEAELGLEYLRSMVERQEQAGADFLDLNVDEIALQLEKQKSAMQWLVRTIQGISKIPIAIDSSNVEIIQAGLEACNGKHRVLLNSASLERLEALDLAVQYQIPVIVTAAGKKGMPQNDEERMTNATRIIDVALAKGIVLSDIYVDALVFPVSVDSEFGKHCLEAFRKLRSRYGPEIHITGGLSNVSFGLPCRRLLNDAFILLSVEAGADSGIVDPVASHLQEVFSIDRNSRSYQLAEDVLLGRDQNCRNFLRAYRKKEIQAS